MTRKMYIEEKQMTEQQAIEALKGGNHGTISVNGDDGFPYAVPVNYVYVDGKIYIHSAKYGYKVECLEKNNKVCFSAILGAKVVSEKFTAAFRSVVINGTTSFVEDEAEKKRILEEFIYHLTPDNVENGMKFVKGAIGKTLLICLDPISITGKQSMGDKFDA